MAKLSEMTKTERRALPVDDLRSQAKGEGVEISDDDNKPEILAKIAAKFDGDANDDNDADDGEGVGGSDGNEATDRRRPGPRAALPEAATQTVGSGWGSPPASGNGAHTADTVPPAEAVGGSPVEGDGPGQGRVMAPNADVHPADAPVAAAPQANAGTPDHHDASAAGQGPGGTTLDPEAAARTGAAIADPNAREPAGTDYVNDLARHSAGEHNSPTHVGNTDADFDDEQAVVIGNGAVPNFGDMLRASVQIDAQIRAAKAPPVNPDAPQPTFAEEPAGVEIVPHANEKITDAIGSTHDAGGREVAKGAAGPGLPVYVGTAQPVEQPEAQWRANTGV